MTHRSLKKSSSVRSTRMKTKPIPTTEPTNFIPIEEATLPRGEFFVVIPTVETFTPDERAVYDRGQYPLRICDHLPEHETFVDFLIDQAACEIRRFLANATPANDVDPNLSKKGGR